MAAAAQPLAELQQVGAVGLERVARQAALELEVGEEVEQQVLERLGATRSRCRRAVGRAGGCGVAMATSFQASARAADSPARCNARFRLLRGVLRRACSSRRPMIVFASRQPAIVALELGERVGLDVDPLVLDLLPGLVAEVGREVDVALLVGEPGRREVRGEVLPGRRRLADLLGQLALAAAPAGSRPRSSSLPAGSSSRSGIAGRLARLAHQPDVLAVVGDDRDRARVRDPLARDLLAVLVAERALADVDDLPLEHGARLQAFEARAHAAAMLAGRLTPPPPRRAARGRRRASPPARRRSRARSARGCARCRSRG